MRVPSVLEPGVEHHSRALDHADVAAGLTRLKKGFGATEADDVLFALGFPALKLLTVGDPVEQTQPEELATVEACERRILRDGSYAEVLAARVQRAAWSFNSNRPNGTWHPDAMSAMLESGPLTAQEFEKVVLERAKDRCYLGVYPNSSLLAEAYIGPKAVIAVLLQALRATAPAQLGEPWGFRGQLLYGLIPTLARVPAPLALEVKDELAAILAKFRKGTAQIEPGSQADVLLRIIDPRAAVDAAMAQGPIDPSVAAFVEDDPEFVLSVLKASKPHKFTSASSAVAFVVGEAALEYFLLHWKDVKQVNYQASMVQEFGRIGSPMVPRLMLEMAASSKVRKLASAWFLCHPDRGRPELEHHTSGPLAKAAGTLLKALDRAAQ